MCGEYCIYVCVDDVYGIVIMFKVEQLGVILEVQIVWVQVEYEWDFVGFLVEYDNYYIIYLEENWVLFNCVY